MDKHFTLLLNCSCKFETTFIGEEWGQLPEYPLEIPHDKSIPIDS